MALLSSIKSKVWGISVLGTGAIAEGIASLRQCIHIILHTTLGTDPLRPLFGSRVYKYQDAPVNIAIPNIKASIIEALAIWEKRIRVLSVTHRHVAPEHLEFEVTYLIVDENLIDSIIFNPGGITGGGPPVGLILQAIFPPNIFVTRNYINFSLNNSPVPPARPVGGFPNPTETYNWCVANWGSYGSWQLLADRIILNLNPGHYTQASLGIFVLEAGGGVDTRFAAWIPPIIAADTSYNINFNPNGTGVLQSQTISPSLLITKDDLLNFVRTYWGSYGRWEFEYTIQSAADFNNDFNDDFDSQTEGYELVLYSNTVATALLEVEII